MLNYELEVQVLDDRKNILFADRKDVQKVITLPGLNSRSECNTIAKEVLTQCDLIHPSRLIEVEQMIYYLKKRKRNTINEDITTISKNVSNDAPVNIGQLNEYIELLYENITDKIRASYSIKNLAKNPDNLEYLSKNEMALSALARVLREDWKKSMILTTNLMYTFFSLSSYRDFHHVILKYKIGSLCMDIIDFELCRHEEWKILLLNEKYTEGVNIRKSCSTSASMYEIPRTRIPEPVRPKSGHFVEPCIKYVNDVSADEDFMTTSEYLHQLSEMDKKKKYRLLVKKQEHVLRVSFYLLLNMAEDEVVEEKMCKRNIIPLLISTLDGDSDELLTLVVTFLKKLSVIQISKDEMCSLNVIEKSAKLLNSDNADLLHLTLKLLFNLSFDCKLRLDMVRNGFLDKFVSLLRDDRHQEIAMKLLYHLSYDKEVVDQFCNMDCISLITDMLLLSSADHVDSVLMALCINLSKYPSNAEQMVDNNRLHSLLSRAFLYEDVPLMKLIHNISEHDSIRGTFIEFVGDIAQSITETENEEFLMECLGILSNLIIVDLDWAEVFTHFKLTSKLKTLMSTNNADIDLILQVIVLFGTAAYDEGCALLQCESDLINPIISLLRVHQEDDEIVLQIVYMFLVLLSHDTAATYIVNNTEVPAYLIDLLLDSNDEIRKLSNACLNMITERSHEWGTRIKVERFRSHNAQWLQMVDSRNIEPEEEESDELPPYLNTEYLSTATVPVSLDLCNETHSSNTDLEYIEEADKTPVEDVDGQSLDGSL